jgi:hypothetical protein
MQKKGNAEKSACSKHGIGHKTARFSPPPHRTALCFVGVWYQNLSSEV